MYNAEIFNLFQVVIFYIKNAPMSSSQLLKQD